MKRRFRSSWGVALLILGLVCLGATVVVAGAGILGRTEVKDPDRLRVAIRLPSSGARVSVGDSVAVLMLSTGAGPVVRYELWVDGSAEGAVFPEPGENPPPPTAQIPWRPSEPGIHSLIARAFDGNGNVGRSRPVLVEVAQPQTGDRVGLDITLQPGDTLESVSAAFGLTPDELITANPGWSGNVEEGEEIRVPVPGADLPAGFAGDDDFSRSEPANPADQPAPDPAEGLPSRPGSPTATLGEACAVALQWSPSTAADGYEVYRFGSGEMDFTRVGETRGDEAVFEDVAPLAGEYQYLITAVNNQGASEGDPAVIEISADLCPESAPLPEDGMAWLDLELLAFNPAPGFDRAYCYVSPFPGSAFVRIPEDEDAFLTPSGGVWDIDRFASGLQRLSLYHPADQPVHLEMDCWGWQGGDLSRLGTLEIEHPRPDWDGQQLSAAAQGFEALYRIFSHTNSIPQLVPVFAAFGPPPPVFTRRPDSLGECLEKVPAEGGLADAGESFAAALACLTVDLHQLMIWDWNERADPRYTVHDLLGFHLYLDRAGREPDDVPRDEWEAYADVSRSLRIYPMLEPPCGETYSYWATAYGVGTEAFADPGPAQEGPQGFIPPIPGEVHPITPVMESDPGNAVQITGPDCPVEEVLVEITLDDLEMGHTWDSCFDIDGECDDVRLESFGTGTFFLVDEDGNSEQAAEVVFWGDFSGECGLASVCLGLGSVGAHRTIDLSQENLAVCDIDGCDSLGPGNNTVRLWVGDGDNVVIEFSLWDQDDISGDDIWCGTTDDGAGWEGAGKFPTETSVLETGARSVEEWAALDGATGRWDNDDLDRQDAECTMTFVTSAVEVRQ